MQQFFGCPGFFLEAFLKSVDFDDQHRLGIGRKSWFQRLFHGIDGDFVDHFHRRGNDASADDGGYPFAGFVNTIENPQQRDRFFRVRGQTAGDFGDNPEGPLRTDYQRQHVRSGNGKSLAA